MFRINRATLGLAQTGRRPGIGAARTVPTDVDFLIVGEMQRWRNGRAHRFFLCAFLKKLILDPNAKRSQWTIQYFYSAADLLDGLVAHRLNRVSSTCAVCPPLVLPSS